jgi:hypothetical protein
MKLFPRSSSDASVTQSNGCWRLEIPAGKSSVYRLAQLDDYAHRIRNNFPWRVPTTLSLRARVSDRSIPGTWGFGFWNDPFSVILGLGGMKRPLPVLPNAAWFFHASPDNYLSLRVDKPASGFLAATFSSPRIPSIFLTPGIFLSPLLVSPARSRWLRAKLNRIVKEDGTQIKIDVTQWNHYLLRWERNIVLFEINGQPILNTLISPLGPLGLVIWIDNQFAAFTPSGKLSAGTLENQAPAWMEIDGIEIFLN